MAQLERSQVFTPHYPAIIVGFGSAMPNMCITVFSNIVITAFQCHLFSEKKSTGFPSRQKGSLAQRVKKCCCEECVEILGRAGLCGAVGAP